MFQSEPMLPRQGTKPNKRNICYGCVHGKSDTATKTQHFPFISIGSSVLQQQWSQTHSETTFAADLSGTWSQAWLNLFVAAERVLTPTQLSELHASASPNWSSYVDYTRIAPKKPCQLLSRHQIWCDRIPILPKTVAPSFKAAESYSGWHIGRNAGREDKFMNEWQTHYTWGTEKVNVTSVFSAGRRTYFVNL